MGMLSWIGLGLIAGLAARYLMPGRISGGLLLTILLGIAGAMLGGFIGTLLGWGGVSGFDLRSLAIAVGGALLLLFGYQMIQKR